MTGNIVKALLLLAVAAPGSAGLGIDPWVPGGAVLRGSQSTASAQVVRETLSEDVNELDALLGAAKPSPSEESKAAESELDELLSASKASPPKAEAMAVPEGEMRTIFAEDVSELDAMLGEAKASPPAAVAKAALPEEVEVKTTLAEEMAAKKTRVAVATLSASSAVLVPVQASAGALPSVDVATPAPIVALQAAAPSKPEPAVALQVLASAPNLPGPVVALQGAAFFGGRRAAPACGGTGQPACGMGDEVLTFGYALSTTLGGAVWGGVMAFILLSMCLYGLCGRRKATKKAAGVVEDDSDQDPSELHEVWIASQIKPKKGKAASRASK